VNSTTFSSSTSLTVDLSVSASAATGARDLTVTNVGGATSGCTGCFTVTTKPTIVSATPSSGPQGATHQAITLSGSGFQADSSVSFSGTGVTVHSATYVDSGHLALDVSVAPNAATGARAATVTNRDGGTVTKTAVFTVNATPTFTGVTKSALRRGQTVTVALAGTGFAASFVTGGSVSFGPDIAVGTVVRNSATKLTATVTVGPSAALGARSATIVNPDGGSATCAACVTVVADPVISSLAPPSRPRGAASQTVVLSGSGLQTGATVKVSGSGVTINSVAWNSPTQLTLNVSVGGSAALGARDVTVTNPNGGIGICVGCFTVNAKPVLTSVTPSSRPRGASHQTVTLAGSGFQSGLAVSMSGTGVTVAVVAVTATTATLDVSVAANAATGNRTVTVTNPDGGTVAKTNAFKVT
jgi:hypothetical protein